MDRSTGNRSQASQRRGIAQPGDLHRGRLGGEDGQAIVGQVQGEIDEDVDPVLADHLGKLPLVEPMVSRQASQCDCNLAVIASVWATSE